MQWFIPYCNKKKNNKYFQEYLNIVAELSLLLLFKCVVIMLLVSFLHINGITYFFIVTIFDIFTICKYML